MVDFQLNNKQTDENINQFLLFYLGGELYATPLLQVKEIVKLMPTKKIPFMKNYFKGLINLRGQVISVIDLRMKLGMTIKDPNQCLIMIVENNGNSVGVIFDDLHSVHIFNKEDLNLNQSNDDSEKNKYFIGVGHLKENALVNLIDLGLCIGGEDMRLLTEIKHSA